MSDTTIDFFTKVHKGLRRALFALVDDAARIDVSEDAALGSLLSRVRACIALLESHAEHEDRHILPLVDRVASDWALIWRRDHVDLSQQAVIVQHAFARVLSCEVSQRAEWMSAAHLQLCAFVGQQLTHMAFEERIIMPSLGAAMSHTELDAAYSGLLSAIPPSEMLEFMSHMLPALNVSELLAVLAGMRAAPANVREDVRSVARRVLAPEHYQRAHDALGA